MTKKEKYDDIVKEQRKLTFSVIEKLFEDLKDKELIISKPNRESYQISGLKITRFGLFQKKYTAYICDEEVRVPVSFDGKTFTYESGNDNEIFENIFEYLKQEYEKQ